MAISFGSPCIISKLLCCCDVSYFYTFPIEVCNILRFIDIHSTLFNIWKINDFWGVLVSWVYQFYLYFPDYIYVKFFLVSVYFWHIHLQEYQVLLKCLVWFSLYFVIFSIFSFWFSRVFHTYIQGVIGTEMTTDNFRGIEVNNVVNCINICQPSVLQTNKMNFYFRISRRSITKNFEILVHYPKIISSGDIAFSFYSENDQYCTWI